MAASETTAAGAEDERAWVARVVVGSRTVASAPPAVSKDRCCACSTLPEPGRGAARSNTFNSSKASQPTVGTAITRSRQHAADSNIHVGISTDPRFCLFSRPDRQTACPYLTRRSYTATRRPNHGCHGEQTSRDSVLWVLGSRLVQSRSPAHQPGARQS